MTCLVVHNVVTSVQATRKSNTLAVQCYTTCRNIFDIRSVLITSRSLIFTSLASKFVLFIYMYCKLYQTITYLDNLDLFSMPFCNMQEIPCSLSY